MNGKQQPNGTRTVYGTCAGMISLGPIDFVWGLMINNTLVWPSASIWSDNTWAANKVLLVAGVAYQTPVSTTADPPASPWVTYATAWSAGTYALGAKVVRAGGVYQNLIASNAAAPPASIPSLNLAGTGYGLRPAQITNNWLYLGSPDTFAISANWPINSIVAWKGRLYTNSAATGAEPPASPWRLWYQPRSGFPNPLKITVGGYGDAYIYWGTDTQTLDTVNEKVLDSLNHPAYRSRAVLVIKDFLFGTETTAAPDITVLCARTPIQTLITGASANMDADWQVNPWCVLAELLTNPIWGLGLPNSMFDSTTWQAEADRCAANPQLYYISPVYTSLTAVRDIVADLMSYPDAFVFWNILGRIQAGHWPHGEAAPIFDNTTTVNRDTITKELSGQTEGWGGTFNSVEVSFDDIQAAFKNRSVVAPNLFNRNIVKRLLAQKVDKQHIVRINQALAWATEMAKLSGDLFSTGTVECKAERLTGVNPGSLFEITDDVLQTSQVHRCLEKTLSAPPKGTVTMKHQLERGVSPLPYAPSPLTTTPPVGELPAPIQNYQFVQLPAALGGGPNRLACLACRADNVTNALQFWYQQADTNSFQLLGTAKEFGVAGLLAQSINIPQFSNLVGIVTQGNTYSFNNIYPWNVTVTYGLAGGPPSTTATETTDYEIDYINGTITIVIGGAIATGSNVNVIGAVGTLVTLDATVQAGDIELIATSQTKDEIADNTILLFLFQASNPSLFEICAVTTVAASGGNYVFNLKRQQYGTLAGGDGSYVWTTGDIAVAVYRRDIVVLAHNDFAALQAANGVAKFILAPGSPYGQATVDQIFDPIANPGALSTEVSYTFENIYAPTVAWVEQLVNGVAIASFATHYAPTDVFKITRVVSDAEGDAVQSILSAENGSTTIIIAQATYPPVRTRTAVTTFSLPDGTWQIYYTIVDQSGNISKNAMTAIGGGSPVQIIIDSSAGTVCIAPTATPPSDSYGSTQHVVLSSATAGATIHHSLVALGAAPGAYTTGTTVTVPLLNASSKWSLYAYASHAGLTDSAVTRIDYTWESNL
jgi:hypothetical protein